MPNQALPMKVRSEHRLRNRRVSFSIAVNNGALLDTYNMMWPKQVFALIAIKVYIMIVVQYVILKMRARTMHCTHKNYLFFLSNL